ncbi:conserved hypothetical protein [Vibrio coralliirubri]|nr:conserved hypothetical protein [Vibrio coralliirubri]
MNQLLVLSILSWGSWWLFFKEDPKTINAIALMMAAFAFSGLLSLHWIMKFMVLPLKGKKR